MALSASQVAAAVDKAAANPQTVLHSISPEAALADAIQIIKIIADDMPWYKKVILSVKVLVGGLEDYLRGQGWSV